MHQLTLSTHSEWDDLLLEVALEEYLKIEGRGAPYVFEPFLFFENTAPNDYDAAYHNLCRLATLDRLIDLGHVLPDDAVNLYRYTYQGTTLPIFSNETLYQRDDHYHYRRLRTNDMDAQELLDLLSSDQIYTQEMTDDGFRMVTFDFTADVLDTADMLHSLLYRSNIHLMTMSIPHEHNYCCSWYAVSDIQGQFDYVCEGDGDVIAETYELDRFRTEGQQFEGIPCYVVTQHAYKGGGFSCIN